uniref:Odorant binding protein 3 n=1 Tax=Sclerodermus sp. MQW-2015 TaxID=1729718 RepID=A0A0N9JS10_9HYME|nr:odorant binding protein 3 [Sclerodermus sp. MQW-2015]
MREVRLLIATALLLVLLQINHVECRMTKKQFTDGIYNLRKRCIKRLGTPVVLVDNARKGIFPKDPALMCYQRCVMSMMKILKEDRIDLDMLTTQVNLLMPIEMADKSLSISAECMNAVKSTNACEAAYEFVVCFYEKDSETYFFP